MLSVGPGHPLSNVHGVVLTLKLIGKYSEERSALFNWVNIQNAVLEMLFFL